MIVVFFRFFSSQFELKAVRRHLLNEFLTKFGFMVLRFDVISNITFFNHLNMIHIQRGTNRPGFGVGGERVLKIASQKFTLGLKEDHAWQF